MKRILAIGLVLILLLMPLTASAEKVYWKNELNDVEFFYGDMEKGHPFDTELITNIELDKEAKILLNLATKVKGVDLLNMNMFVDERGALLDIDQMSKALLFLTNLEELPEEEPGAKEQAEQIRAERIELLQNMLPELQEKAKNIFIGFVENLPKEYKGEEEVPFAGKPKMMRRMDITVDDQAIMGLIKQCADLVGEVMDSLQIAYDPIYPEMKTGQCVVIHIWQAESEDGKEQYLRIYEEEIELPQEEAPSEDVKIQGEQYSEEDLFFRIAYRQEMDSVLYITIREKQFEARVESAFSNSTTFHDSQGQQIYADYDEGNQQFVIFAGEAENGNQFLRINSETQGLQVFSTDFIEIEYDPQEKCVNYHSVSENDDESDPNWNEFIVTHGVFYADHADTEGVITNAEFTLSETDHIDYALENGAFKYDANMMIKADIKDPKPETIAVKLHVRGEAGFDEEGTIDVPNPGKNVVDMEKVEEEEGTQLMQEFEQVLVRMMLKFNATDGMIKLRSYLTKNSRLWSAY